MKIGWLGGEECSQKRTGKPDDIRKNTIQCNEKKTIVQQTTMHNGTAAAVAALHEKQRGMQKGGEPLGMNLRWENSTADC